MQNGFSFSKLMKDVSNKSYTAKMDTSYQIMNIDIKIKKYKKANRGFILLKNKIVA